jgi:hypothetical protein
MAVSAVGEAKVPEAEHDGPMAAATARKGPLAGSVARSQRRTAGSKVPDDQKEDCAAGGGTKDTGNGGEVEEFGSNGLCSHAGDVRSRPARKAAGKAVDEKGCKGTKGGATAAVVKSQRAGGPPPPAAAGEEEQEEVDPRHHPKSKGLCRSNKRGQIATEQQQGDGKGDLSPGKNDEPEQQEDEQQQHRQKQAQPQQLSKQAADETAAAGDAPLVVQVGLTGMHSEERSKWAALLRKLKVDPQQPQKVKYSSTTHDWQAGTTHLVAESLKRNEKTLCGMAAGAWLVGVGWLEAAAEAGGVKEVEEGGYELQGDANGSIAVGGWGQGYNPGWSLSNKVGTAALNMPRTVACICSSEMYASSQGY